MPLFGLCVPGLINNCHLGLVLFSVRCMSFKVFVYFLGGRDAQDEEEWHDGDILARGADTGDLLEKADAEKEDVRIAAELFKQELGNEGDDIIFRGGDLIRLELLGL